MSAAPARLPLAGVRVIELSHVVMGAACGLVLADMGAEVIKIERAPDGDETRRFGGFGRGLFHYFNRNKTSLAVDLKDPRGKAVLERAVTGADVLVENFGPGAMARLGFDYAACAALNPRIVYCALKGFMPGPYEHRPSLDNLVQMMGGLAYMTGPAGRPLRAGASVTDILGATFGALGVIAALRERDASGRGQQVTASLFEATAFLVGQHMSTAAISGEVLPPMPEGDNPWAIYELFATREGAQICIGIISDRQWRSFCEHVGLDDLAADESVATNEGRFRHVERVRARIGERIGALTLAEAVAACDRAGVPFAPVNRPDDLFEDPHLLASGGLVETRLADGRRTRLPKIPLRMDGHDFGLRREAPDVGEGGRGFLRGLGYADSAIDALAAAGVVALPEPVEARGETDAGAT